MDDFLDVVEQRRLEAGVTQASAARALGITQPHYSKVVGGVAALTPELEQRLRVWLANDLPDRSDRAVSQKERARILELTRLIQRNLRELNGLLGSRRVSSFRRSDRVK